jgi:two-component system phosphate regulon sensor histidine kinase PhoR
MAENRPGRWRVAYTYAAVIVAIALLLILILNWLIRSTYTRSVESLLRAEVGLKVGNPDLLAAWESDPAQLGSLLAGWAATTRGRMTAFDAAGAPIADSTGSLPTGTVAPEVSRALAASNGRAVRFDGPDGERTLHLAAAVVESDAPEGAPPLGVLRWSVSLADVAAEWERLQWLVSLAVLAATAIFVTLIVVETEGAARTIRRLTGMVERALAGEFPGHVLTHRGGEIGQLTRATNMLVDKHRKATKRRNRERDRLNTVLMHMSAGALILNEIGRVRLINPAGAEMLHTAPERALRQSFIQVAWDHRIAEVWQRCQQSGQEESESIELGPDRFLRVTVTPFMRGHANGYLVIMHDLTYLRRLEKIRRDFVSNVSHELRTPLASMAALVDTLRDGALDDPPAAQRFLGRMEVEVDKMTQMVQELLELSRIESGQVPLRLNASTVQQFVQPAVDRLLTQAGRAGVQLTVDIPAGLPRVAVDAERMQQVMMNLLHNAIKFTPPHGRVTVAARVRKGGGGEQVIVSISDTGVGIPAADLPRIFERFYKADRSRSGGGTGLGLAIAKHTVQAHGGQIWAESTEGAGSTFQFGLPAQGEAESADHAADAVAQDAPAAPRAAPE